MKLSERTFCPWLWLTHMQRLHCTVTRKTTGWLKRIMGRNNLKTLPELGFTCGTPQTPAAQTEFDQFCNHINNGVDMTISEAARVRRLHLSLVPSLWFTLNNRCRWMLQQREVESFLQHRSKRVWCSSNNASVACALWGSCSPAMPW